MWPPQWLPQIEEQLKSALSYSDIKTIFQIISLAFNITPCYSNQSTVWYLCLLIGSLIFISSQRWDEKHTGEHTFTHTRESTQGEISWLLKYNYLTAACHLGRCLDRLFLSVFLSVSFLLFLSLFLCISLDFSFPCRCMLSPSYFCSSVLFEALLDRSCNVDLIQFTNFQYQLTL